MPLVPERIAHEMKPRRELEPKERRDRGYLHERDSVDLHQTL